MVLYNNEFTATTRRTLWETAMKSNLQAAILVVIASVCGTAGAMEPDPYFQGLISFRDGPDPAGKTPVYWATSRTLHHVVHPRAAVAKFGPAWDRQIVWCGDSAGQPRPGRCSEIYYRWGRGRQVDQNTLDLLHP